MYLFYYVIFLFSKISKILKFHYAVLDNTDTTDLK